MNTRVHVLAAALLCTVGGVGLAKEPYRADVVEGRLAVVTEKTVEVAGVGTFPLSATTECFDWRGDKTTCSTLAAVGYADKGRVTLRAGIAQRIDILELQQ